MCLGQQARDANKAAKRQYEYQLAQRKQNWMNQIALTRVEQVQYEQTLDASHVGLGNAYAELQEKFRDQIGAAMQESESDFQQYMQENVGANLAASGQTGRSIDRISTVELGRYLAKSSRRAYGLTQSARDISKEQAKAASQARQMQMQAFANANIVKNPDLAPPKPVMQNVGMAAFNDALSIGSSLATIATPFVASSKKLKANVQLLGRSIAGHNIYKFNYKGDSRKYIGVLAEEIQQTNPEAVATLSNGYLGVNYDLLDVNFKEVPAW